MTIHAAARTVEIRPFEPADLASAHTLSRQVGWSQTLADWAFLGEHAKGYVAIQDDRFVGITLYWTFGDTAASVGAVMVDESHRGLGIAGRLLERCLTELNGRSVLLYATQAGLPLYAKRGFAPFETIDQHQGIVAATAMPDGSPRWELRLLEPGHKPVVLELAERASGIDRSIVTTSLLERSTGVLAFSGGRPVGFALYRRYGPGWGLGPVVALDVEAGCALIEHCLAALVGQFVRIDVLAELNLQAWLAGFGLVCSSSAVGMQRGTLPSPTGPVRRVAIATQAMG